MHKWILTLSWAALVIPFNAAALGLGDINVRSALNQPFNAEIELTSVRPDELDSLTVTLASSAAFTQAGLDRPALLTQLRFQVENKANGKPYLRVYTQEAIKEPFLNYLVEVNWSSGHLLREYTVLLDPPVGLVAELPTVQAPPATNSSNTTPSKRLSKSLFESAPGQQTKPGVAPAVKARQPSAQVNTAVNGPSYGPTQKGEGLWGIAKNLLADDSADVNQMMLALLKANPEAFINNNINTMKSGYVLRVPTSDEVTALSRQEALSLVNEQTTRWKDPAYNLALKTPTPSIIEGTTAGAAKAAPDSISKPEEAAPSADTRNSNAQLKLVPALAGGTSVPVNQSEMPFSVNGRAEPTNVLDAAQAAEIEKVRLETLNKDLTLANENLEAKRLENEELSSRLTELEAQTDSIQRLITLKNEELAALQTTMGELQSRNTAALVNLEKGQTAPQSAAISEPLTPTASAVDKAKDIAERGIVSLRNIMGELSRNPMALGIIAFAALLLVSLLWIIKRRRTVNAQIIENPALANAKVVPAAFVAATIAQSDVMPVTTAINESQPQPETKLTEAQADPDGRHEVQLKLLEIYHLTNSKGAFVTQAEALHADLAGNGDAVWDKVVVMGREICPEHPLFSGNGNNEQAHANESNELPIFITGSSIEQPVADDVVRNISAETDVDADFWKSKSEQPVDNTIEFEFGSTAALPNSGIEKISSASEAELPETLANYDLVASQYELEIAALGQEAVESITEPESDTPVSDFDTDHKFDFNLEKEAGFLAKANTELVAPRDDQFSDGLEFDSGLLINADEINTKLELAQAYIDMGDPEGAQSILDEVMKEGDGVQKEEAQALMLKVG